MILLTAALLVPFLIMVLAPRSAEGRLLHRALVEPPARLLNKGPLKLLLAVLVFFAVVGFAFSAPELFVMIGVTDVTLCFDAVVVSTVVGAIAAVTLRGVAAAQAIHPMLARLTPARRGSRQRQFRPIRRRRPRRQAPDADPVWAGGWALSYGS